jgi:leucyl aminopeptidase
MADADRWRDAFAIVPGGSQGDATLAAVHDDEAVTRIEVVPRAQFPAWLAAQPRHVAEWLRASGFAAKAHTFAFLPAAAGTLAAAAGATELPALPPHRVVFVANDDVDTAGGDDGGLRSPFAFSSLAASLPKGRYAFDPTCPLPAGVDPALSWALGSYAYRRYKQPPPPLPPARLRGKNSDGGGGARGGGNRGGGARGRLPAAHNGPVLVRAAPVPEEAAAVARATFLVRDLINTPAEDCGPAELERAARQVAAALQATSVHKTII